MKVLHVIESLERGGAERVLATLARALRTDLEQHVVSLVGLGPLVADLRLAGVQVYSLELGSRREWWRALPQLARLVRRIEPDVLHTHLRFSELYAASIPRPSRTKLVATFHNLGFDAAPLVNSDRAVRTIERRLLKHRFDAFFAVSRQSAESYRRHLDLGEVTVVYNPVDVERVRRFAAHRDCAGGASELRAGNRKLVVQVGSFRPLKGHDVALDALRQASPEDRFVWVCVGDGPGREAVEQQVRSAGLTEWVHFAGERGYDDALGWIAEADVVIQPSRAEGVPLVLLEAMALERPVVATRVGGIPEVFTDGVTGLLVEPSHSAELGTAIQKILKDPHAAMAITLAARREVERRFDAPIIAAQWLTHYRALLDGRA